MNEIGFCWDYNKGLFDLQIKRYLDTVGIYEKEKNNPLWNWISSIRHNYNKGTLDDWKLEKLLSIGFVFNVKDKYFDDMLVELLKYHKQNKTYHIKPSHSKLARWATSLKANYEKGTISEYRSKKLIEIGFVNEMCKK